MLDIVLGVITLVSLVFAALCLHRMSRWEHHLRGARIAIAYKGRVKMSPPLIEWFQWSQAVAADKNATGRTVYHMGNTTIAILQPRSHNHGKTEVKTVKEAA